MRRIISIMILLLLASQSYAQKHFFDAADKFFKNHVEKGKVKYEAIHDDPQNLNKLIMKIAAMNLAKLDDQAQKAFYINAYNLLSIKTVINHYPMASPNDVDGFFDEIKHEVAGASITLDQLEKKRLYENWSDARLHFALVCAANGCPPLKKGAFYPENLDQQLARQTEKALKDEDFIRVDYEGRRVEVSQIFNWYKDDFLAEANSILDYINKHRNDPLPSDTRVGFYQYDWALNEVD